jgi:hypothetical protein
MIKDGLRLALFVILFLIVLGLMFLAAQPLPLM